MKIQINVFDSVNPHLSIIGAEHLKALIEMFCRETIINRNIQHGDHLAHQVVYEPQEDYWGYDGRQDFLNMLTEHITDARETYRETVTEYADRFVMADQMPESGVIASMDARVLKMFAALVNTDSQIHVLPDGQSFALVDPESDQPNNDTAPAQPEQTENDDETVTVNLDLAEGVFE